MRLREIYEKKMQAQLDKLEAEIGELMEQSDQTKTNLQLEYYTIVDELRTKLEAANQKFYLLEQASEENWNEFKSEFELVWDSLRELIKSVNSP
jgi:quinol monooxygenase YgiN